MQNILVTRYHGSKNWSGCIEPADKSWIAFVDTSGKPTFFLHRDAETGAVLPNDTEQHPVAIESIRAEQKRREDWAGPVEGVTYPVLAGETFQGRTTPPEG